ncbi:MAG TPA: hypothetical protein VGM88_18900 [Kofleriaceae bacterium]
MSTFRTALLSSAIFLGLAAPIAQADKAPPPTAPAKDAPKETISKADAERFMAFFNKLIDVIVTNQADCPKMATAINSHIDSNAALIKEMNDPKNQNKDVPKEYKDKMDTRVQNEMMPALQKKCMMDKGVQTAMERMAKK